MAKICPETNDIVLYLTCLECEDKVCLRQEQNNNDEQKTGDRKNEGNSYT